MAKKDWIKDATKNKGALRETLSIPEGETIPQSRLDAEQTRLRATAKDGKLTPAQRKLLRQVNLAEVLRRMR